MKINDFIINRPYRILLQDCDREVVIQIIEFSHKFTKIRFVKDSTNVLTGFIGWYYNSSILQWYDSYHL